MSLGCARCGDCCDPVHLAVDQRDLVDRWREYVADGGQQPQAGSDIAFILAHWTELEHKDIGTTYRCAFFDPDTRMCTAHDQRPPVCRDFPFYDQPGNPQNLESRADGPWCSYWLDVPPADRPADARPLIPIEVLR